MTRISCIALTFVLLITCTACQPDMSDASAPVDSITYVNHGSEYIPVSFVAGGEQKLTGYEPEWYDWKDEVNIRIANAPQADSLRKIDSTDMYSGPIPEYLGLPALIFNTIASDGEWDFFPVKVYYEKYSLDNQPNRQDWADYFNDRLAHASPGISAVFNEAWTFDLEGKAAALVTVSNVVWHYSDRKDSAAPVPLPSYSAKCYNLSALFVEGCEPFLLSESIYNAPSSEPLSAENGIYESFLPPLDGSWYESLYSSIQHDAQGNLVECPVFSCGEAGYPCRTMMLLCDIDGDGKPELLTMQTVIYAPVVVYKLIDGIPHEVFRVSTGA